MAAFSVIANDMSSSARLGRLETAHGAVETPIFMPVGTMGSVKGIHQHELHADIKAQIILGNTYHLFLRPGIDILSGAGGLHRFIGWDRPMLTDSGGYQVHSLSSRRKITEEGVQFASHIDGSKHLFTPESVMDIQRTIGADFIMAFDECTSYPCDKSYAAESMARTHRWLDRCYARFDETTSPYSYDQLLCPIVQGSTYQDLRKESAEVIASHNSIVNAIGGLSVGEPHDEMYAMTDAVCQILPESSARYLMGVGLPENILECIALGVDMFDCVLPSRNARHGILYTWDGVIRIKNHKWSNDFTPIDASATNHTSRHYTKAYLRHLFQAKERLAEQIATLHNLSFYLDLVSHAKKHIQSGTFLSWKNSIIPIITKRL